MFTVVAGHGVRHRQRREDLRHAESHDDVAAAAVSLPVAARREQVCTMNRCVALRRALAIIITPTYIVMWLDLRYE